MIVEEIDRYYSARSLEREKEGFRIRPSNIGDCLRKLAFLLNGSEREPLSGETQRVFEHGAQRGTRLEEIASKIWFDAQTQVPLKIPFGKRWIDGTADLWIPSIRTLVDWKTVSVFGFALLDEEGPSEDYQFQIHAYRSAFPNPREVRAVLVYESKDSDVRKGVRAGALKEIEVPYTDELEERYQARLRDLEAMQDAKDAGTLKPEEWTGLPSIHWKCRVEKDGRPRYCPIGPLRGKCHD